MRVERKETSDIRLDKLKPGDTFTEVDVPFDVKMIVNIEDIHRDCGDNNYTVCAVSVLDGSVHFYNSWVARRFVQQVNFTLCEE